MIDVERARRETPGCEERIHLNNAGAALQPARVLEAVLGHLELETQLGGYEAEDAAADALARVYDSAATLIGAGRDELAIVENATRAWDMAFYSIPFQPGDRILTAEAEYASNYIAYLQVARRTGAVVEPVASDETGTLSVEALREAMDERVRLISITHVPTNGGLVNPAEEVGAVAREAGCLYLLDACQSVGQLPLDVAAIGCDLLSATSRKFLRGPRGCGFLYVRAERLDELEPPFLDLHAAEWTAPDGYDLRPDARRFENWESNVAAKLGLGAAIDYALEWGIEEIRARVVTLADGLRERLAAIPGVTVRDLGRVRCGIVSFTIEGVDPPAAQAALHAHGINVSVAVRPHTLLDMRARKLERMLRASVHYYNTEDELDRACAAIANL